MPERQPPPPLAPSLLLDATSLESALQTLVTQLGRLMKVDYCILRLFTPDFKLLSSIYQAGDASINREILEQTVWPVDAIEAIASIEVFPSLSTIATATQQKIRQAFQQADIGAALLIPLQPQKQLIAVLGLYHCGTAHDWCSEEIQLAVMVAAQITLAIVQAQAYEQVQALARQEATINSITAAIRSSLDPQAIFTAITHQLGQGLAVDGCALSLWTASDEFVQCVGLYDRHQRQIDPLPQSCVPIAQNPVLQQLLGTSAPVVLENMEEHPQMNQFDLPLRQAARALLVVPLIVDGAIIGSISLRQTDHPRHWLPADIELAQAVASQAAIAVQHARLYEKIKQQAEQLRQSEQQVKQLNQYLTESVLNRFLPPAIVNKVAAGELVLDLTPEPRWVTILFSDLVDFTPLASHLGAQTVARLLNEYLEAMAAEIFAHGGTVDKFMGDAVVALFGAPEDLAPDEQARRAIATARAMYRHLACLNQHWHERGLVGEHRSPPVQLRCGIHQGNAVVGMFGSNQRADYTAIGPAVNLAARLQEVAPSDSILVSDTVAQYLIPQEIAPVKSLKLKGIKEPILMFSVNITAKTR